ncbi:unnamed protein product [Nesidiocoris tenuis]|uniref:Uncharacterized protein n=1 Tax=Nesidiocoris tenuis TaxID=355587 RepID=A0A6H5GN85_9HEMI|nr:unnamed protein product [Nesidiocoris tenuis]
MEAHLVHFKTPHGNLTADEAIDEPDGIAVLAVLFISRIAHDSSLFGSRRLDDIHVAQNRRPIPGAATGGPKHSTIESCSAGGLSRRWASCSDRVIDCRVPQVPITGLPAGPSVRQHARLLDQVLGNTPSQWAKCHATGLPAGQVLGNTPPGGLSARQQARPLDQVLGNTPAQWAKCHATRPPGGLSARQQARPLDQVLGNTPAQ